MKYLESVWNRDDNGLQRVYWGTGGSGEDKMAWKFDNLTPGHLSVTENVCFA